MSASAGTSPGPSTGHKRECARVCGRTSDGLMRGRLRLTPFTSADSLFRRFRKVFDKGQDGVTALQAAQRGHVLCPFVPSPLGGQPAGLCDLAHAHTLGPHPSRTPAFERASPTHPSLAPGMLLPSSCSAHELAAPGHLLPLGSSAGEALCPCSLLSSSGLRLTGRGPPPAGRAVCFTRSFKGQSHTAHPHGHTQNRV